MFTIGHINKHGDWDSAYGPYTTREIAEDVLARLKESPIPGVKWEIRPPVSASAAGQTETPAAAPPAG